MIQRARPEMARRSRTTWGRKTCLMLLALLAVGASAAAPAGTGPEEVVGEVLFKKSTLEGETTIVSSQLKAANFVARPGINLTGHWSLTADRLIVNWTYERSLEIWGSTQNPGEFLVSYTADSEQGNTSYDLAEAGSFVDDRDANMLVWMKQGREMSAHLATNESVFVRPAAGERWGAGKYDEGTIGNATLKRMHETTVGNVLLATNGSASLELEGNLTLVVWGSTVNVIDVEGAQDSYRSGEWQTNQTTAGGHPVAQEEHAQLLTLTAVGAHFRFHVETGEGRWTGDDVDTTTRGRVTFDQAQAYLESDDHFYSVRDDRSLSLAGSVEQRLTPSDDAERLHSFVTTEGSAIQMPPSGTIADEAKRYVVDDDLDDAPTERTTFSTEPYQRSMPLLVGSWAGLLLLGGGFAWLALARGGYVGRVPSIEEAEFALVNHDSKRARRLSRRLIRHDGTDLDAWFVYGASLLQEGRYDRAAARLRPPLERHGHGDRAGVAYLVALAHARAGRPAKAIKWLSLAGTEPALLPKIRDEADFEPLHGTEAFDRILRGAATRDVAYL